MRLTRLLPILTTLVLWTVPTMGTAQTSIPPGSTRPVAPSGPTVEGQEVEGLIQRVDLVARTITLDNGQDYLVPAWMGDPALSWEGAYVKLRYGVDGGRNFATDLQVRR